MSIRLGNYNLEGPYSSTDDLRAESGVYVILGRNNDEERWKIVDAGETDNIQGRLKNHDRIACWNRRGYIQLVAAAYYCDATRRVAIHHELRQAFKPLCGDNAKP